MSVEKASVIVQHFIFTREFIWERNATSVMSVVRNLARAHVCKLIRKFTLWRSRSNVRSVGMASVVDQHLMFIINCTWKRNLITVTNVEGPSFMLHIFRNIRESTLGRNPSNVINVVRISDVDHHLIVIVWSTQEKNCSNVRSVGSVSFVAQIFISTRRATHERNLISVRSVGKASFSLRIFGPIRESILERNHMYAKCVVKALL